MLTRIAALEFNRVIRAYMILHVLTIRTARRDEGHDLPRGEGIALKYDVFKDRDTRVCVQASLRFKTSQRRRRSELHRSENHTHQNQ